MASSVSSAVPCVRHSALPTADLAIRKVAALDALTRYDARADAALAGSFAIEPDLWPTSAVIDWLLVAQRWTALPDHEARAAQAEQILRSRLNFQGTTLGFSTERSDFLWWLMVSPDVNANRALLAFMDNPRWREDLPRMVRGDVGRQQGGHWNTTVANAWGALALEKFAAAFEAEPRGREHARGARRNGEALRLERQQPRRQRRVRLAARTRRTRTRARGQRQAVGDGAEPGRDPAEGGLVERVPDREERHAGRCGRQWVAPRRRAPDTARDRGREST